MSAAHSWEVMHEVGRQRREDLRDAYDSALDDEIERIEASDYEIAEVIQGNAAAIALAYASRAERQAIYDAICEAARVNIDQAK